MKYTEALAMCKQALYIPKQLRAAWVSGLHKARHAFPNKAGLSFNQFMRQAEPHDADVVQRLLRDLGFGDQLKGLRYRGMMPVGIGMDKYPMAPISGTSVSDVQNAIMRPDVSWRRYNPGNMLAESADNADRSLKARSRLFTGAPGNGIARSLILGESTPTADIFMSQKYLQTGANGPVLLDPDLPLGGALVGRLPTGSKGYVMPYRTHRWLTEATPADLKTDYNWMQAIRQGGGRTDDIGGFILYPNGTKKPGWVFTTTTTSNPFTAMLREAQSRNVYRHQNNMKSGIRRAKSRFLQAAQNYGMSDASLMEAAKNGQVPNMVTDGNNLVVSTGIMGKIPLTPHDRQVYINNALKTRR